MSDPLDWIVDGADEVVEDDATDVEDWDPTVTADDEIGDDVEEEGPVVDDVEGDLPDA